MIAALALAALLAGPTPLAQPAVLAQATPVPNPKTQNRAPVQANPAPGMPMLPSSAVDRTFALAAMQGNAAELDMAQLALQRSGVDEVKGYAQKMLDEHMRLMSDMAPLLRRALGAPAPPQRLTAPDALAFRHLRTVGPEGFDQAYAMQQIGDHLATMTAFQTEAEDGTDPALKAMAKKWLPTIQAHLELAVQMTRHVDVASPFK